MNRNVFVVQPALPPLEEMLPYLEQIWASKQLTNGASLHQALERALCEYLHVEHICLFSNGTAALITALQALDLKGEVITTPYSFVATAHSLLWNRLTPVFADVDPHTLNLDPLAVERAITSQTTAILPVHCYGHPCDTAGMARVADRHGLKIVYDAAHAFGVKDADGSILRHGDLAVLSFHATKVFNTFEGGAIICADAEMKRRIDQLKNFGIVDETRVEYPGLNGKMSEFNAALGLVQLKHLEGALTRRASIAKRYLQRLETIQGVRCLPDTAAVSNHAYFPILVEPEYPISRDELHNRFKARGIHPRRYFYPLISEFPMYRDARGSAAVNLPHASHAAARVLCLPIYPGLESDVVDEICDFIASQ